VNAYKPISISQRTESMRAKQAFEDFWALGSNRSISLLYKHYEKLPAGAPCSEATLHSWSSMFNWKGRCAQRQALAAADVEKIRRQQVADFETTLHERGVEGLQLSFDRLRELAQARRLGAMAAVQLANLSMRMMARGLRQPESITEERVVHADGEPLTLDAFLALLPEGTRDSVLEAAYWELQARGDIGEVSGEVRDSTEPPQDPEPVRGEALGGPLVE